MGRRHTGVCSRTLLGILAVFCTAISPANAADDLHPVIQNRPPREVMNADILALPAQERQAWLHGAVAMTAQVLAGKDAGASKCVMEWYFETGVGVETIPKVQQRFPEAPATATILTLARRVCPGA